MDSSEGCVLECVGLFAWAICLFPLVLPLLLLLRRCDLVPPCCAEPEKGVPGVGFEQIILHVFQVRKRRGQALVDDGRVG